MIKEIYLAGGCFWGVQYLYSKILGVTSTVCGYAVGDILKEYKDVDLKNKDSNLIDIEIKISEKRHRETVKIKYDDELISLKELLFIYFNIVNVEEKNRQGIDVGFQYQTGIYFIDNTSEKIVNEIIEIEKPYKKNFFVEILPLKFFNIADSSHQNFLNNNPDGYCHINRNKISFLENLNLKDICYNKPAKEILKEIYI